MNVFEKDPAMRAFREQILELFETGEQAIAYLDGHGLEGNRYLLEDLHRLCTALADGIARLEPAVSRKNWLKEIGRNAPLTAARLCETLGNGEIEQAQMQYRCAFAPLFLFWKRYAAFFLTAAVDEASLDAWHQAEAEHYREIRRQPKRDEPGPYRYDLSVLVLFYGHPRMTQDCIDAIHKWTKGRSYELITFDNGSDPETTAWCEGLPHTKKIWYPHNMGSSAAGNLIFTMAHRYVEGKYLLYVSNDVILTPGCADTLFSCMESDPQIAMAAPVCNSASNFQAIDVPYPKDDLSAMTAFARQYNHCDPRKWEDRARLFAIIAVFRPGALRQMFLAMDPMFCFDMFADDDFSCSLRRMGWRQVLCRDAFVHHYGSATIQEGQFAVMDEGRKQFYRKHRLDAWDGLGADLYAGIQMLTLPPGDSARVLALNPLFGESALALCSRLNACGFARVDLDALSEDARWLEDLGPRFGRTGRLADEAAVLGEGTYDIVLVASGLERCTDLRAVLRLAARRLRPGGILITQHRNLFDLAALQAVLQGHAPAHELFLHDPLESPALCAVSDGALEEALRREGLTVRKRISIRNDAWKPAAEQLLSALGLPPQDPELLIRHAVFMVWAKNAGP